MQEAVGAAHNGAMAEEIERKFLVAVPPDPEVLGAGARLRQGYLAVDGAVEVRLRLSADGARLTIKAGSGLSRTEVDLRIDEADALQLWEHTAGRRLEKVRHRVALAGDAVAEVDLYEGHLAGLCTVEVEFPAAPAAAAFQPPEWFGQELTGDPAWSNAALARTGRPS